MLNAFFLRWGFLLLLGKKERYFFCQPAQKKRKLFFEKVYIKKRIGLKNPRRGIPSTDWF